MTDKNTETVPEAVVTPVPPVAAPAAPAAAQPAVVTPDTPKPVDKTVQAFIKQRQERKADKQRIATLEAQVAAAQPAQVVTPAPASQPPVVSAPAQPQAVVPAETVVVVDEEAAIQAIALDKDVQSVPGAIIDIMNIVDSNPKIAKLNAIDSGLAYREAASIWRSNLGIAPKPPTPVAIPTSGGMGGSPVNLQALFQAVDAAKPGTKAYRDAVFKVNEAMNRPKAA